jgi:hypothetical protein
VEVVAAIKAVIAMERQVILQYITKIGEAENGTYTF